MHGAVEVFMTLTFSDWSPAGHRLGAITNYLLTTRQDDRRASCSGLPSLKCESVVSLMKSKIFNVTVNTLWERASCVFLSLREIEWTGCRTAGYIWSQTFDREINAPCQSG